MNIYHYSKDKYDVLKTRALSAPPDKNEKEKADNFAKQYNRAGSYYDHISFFIDPIPVDIVGSIYGKDHRAWSPGNKLFQYEIPVDGLPDFKYEFVETFDKSELYYDESLTISQYKARLKVLTDAKGYAGQDRNLFVKNLVSLKGCTREAFAKANTWPNWNDIKDKYAANVPHIMLYPSRGKVWHSDVKVVTIK